jgi:hypothetical protein
VARGAGRGRGRGRGGKGKSRDRAKERREAARRKSGASAAGAAATEEGNAGDSDDQAAEADDGDDGDLAAPRHDLALDLVGLVVELSTGVEFGHFWQFRLFEWSKCFTSILCYFFMVHHTKRWIFELVYALSYVVAGEIGMSTSTDAVASE